MSAFVSKGTVAPPARSWTQHVLSVSRVHVGKLGMRSHVNVTVVLWALGVVFRMLIFVLQLQTRTIILTISAVHVKNKDYNFYVFYIK